MQEEWREIPATGGLYLISSHGRCITKHSCKPNGRIKAQSLDRTGYLKTNLSLDGKNLSFMTHRLVAQAFIPNPKKLPFVNHIDGLKTNNHVSNLEWCDQSHNMKHSFANGLHRKRWGAAHHNAKAVMCVETGVVYGSIGEAARSLGKTPDAIKVAHKYPHRTAYGYHWRLVTKPE